jgi:hypothetical protein
MIVSRLSNAWLTLKNNTVFFIAIVFLELLFLISLGVILNAYSGEVVQSLNSISAYLGEQEWLKVDPTQENLRELAIPATDPGKIAAERGKMLEATQLFFLKGGVLFLLFCGMAWLLSYRMVHGHNLKELLKLYGKLLIVAVPYLTVLSLLLYSIVVMVTSQFFTLNASQTYLFVLPLFVAVLVLYFMPVSFALVPRIPLNEIVRGTLHHGIRRCVFLFVVYGAALLVFCSVAIAMLLLMEISFFISMLLGILLLAAIAFTRILLLVGLTEQSR